MIQDLRVGNLSSRQDSDPTGVGTVLVQSKEDKGVASGRVPMQNREE